MNQTITRSLYNKRHTTFEEVAGAILPNPRISVGANAPALILPMLASLIAAILLIAQ